MCHDLSDCKGFFYYSLSISTILEFSLSNSVLIGIDRSFLTGDSYGCYYLDIMPSQLECDWPFGIRTVFSHSYSPRLVQYVSGLYGIYMVRSIRYPYVYV
jgi:hypothetical protein